MSPTRDRVEARIAQEALFGTLPILSRERLYGFVDALLLLSGYCIATWSYTQGGLSGHPGGLSAAAYRGLLWGHPHAVPLSAACHSVCALRHRHLDLAAGSVRRPGGDGHDRGDYFGQLPLVRGVRRPVRLLHDPAGRPAGPPPPRSGPPPAWAGLCAAGHPDGPVGTACHDPGHPTAGPPAAGGGGAGGGCGLSGCPYPGHLGLSPGRRWGRSVLSALHGGQLCLCHHPGGWHGGGAPSGAQ